jgi:hypothetical protein
MTRHRVGTLQENKYTNILMIISLRHLTPCNLVFKKQFLAVTCIYSFLSNRKTGPFGSSYLPMNQSTRCHVQDNNNLHLTFMGPCIVIIFQYISNKMQRYTVYFIWKLLYIKLNKNQLDGPLF